MRRTIGIDLCLKTGGYLVEIGLYQCVISSIQDHIVNSNKPIAVLSPPPSLTLCFHISLLLQYAVFAGCFGAA